MTKVASVRTLAVAAAGVLGLSVVLLPWYSLGAYEPNGWDATYWARVALAAAVLNIVAVRLGHYRLAAALAAVALAAVVFRTVQPPDFGFGFDGLKVPVERQVGCWVALGSSLLALLASLRLALARPEAARSPQAPSSAAASP